MNWSPAGLCDDCEGMKPSVKTGKDPEEWTRFGNAMKSILSVSKEELLRREAEYKKQSDANPKKRGPKKARA